MGLEYEEEKTLNKHLGVGTRKLKKISQVYRNKANADNSQCSNKPNCSFKLEHKNSVLGLQKGGYVFGAVCLSAR